MAVEVLRLKRKDLKKEKNPIDSYPEILREVTKLLQAMPPTQVSVERLFSALKFLKSDRRSRLKGEILNDMLLLKAKGI